MKQFIITLVLLFAALTASAQKVQTYTLVYNKDSVIPKKVDMDFVKAIQYLDVKHVEVKYDDWPGYQLAQQRVNKIIELSEMTGVVYTDLKVHKELKDLKERDSDVRSNRTVTFYYTIKSRRKR